MNNPISKKYIPLIIMLLILAGMGLIFWFGIMPLRHFIVDKADEIQQFYTVRENRQRQINQLPELQSQFDTIVAGEKRLDILLPKSRIVDFVKTLEGLARESRVEISIQSSNKGEVQTKTVKKPVKKSTDQENKTAEKTAPTIIDMLPYDSFLRISIKAHGEYADIVTFLHKMETLPFGLDVIGIQVKKIEDDEAKNVPDASNPNPFLLSPGNTVSSIPATVPISENAGEKVEATFDTVVYVNTEQ